MPKRDLAIVEVTPERELEPPPSKRRRVSLSGMCSSSPPVGSATSVAKIAFSGANESAALPVSKSALNGGATHERPPGSDITRIISWNVETPVPFLDLTSSQSSVSLSNYLNAARKVRPEHAFLRALLKEWEWPDFVCVQEVRARPGDGGWREAMRAAANGISPLDKLAGEERRGDGGPTYTAYWALNISKRGQRRFGVCTLVSHSWVPRIRKERTVEWDAEGRVHILEFGGWALVNVYALNGSDYAWVDPHSEGDTLAAALPQKTRNERKREFNMLLLEEVKTMRFRGLRPVLIGDFNISLAKLDCYPRLRTEAPHALARKAFNERFLRDTGVVDVFRHVHGETKAYSWFAKGKPAGKDAARVDYALVDNGLVKDGEEGEGTVVGTGYGGKNEGKSDHGIVWLDLRGMADLKPTPPETGVKG